MRIYSSVQEMFDETYREIWKRGQTIFDATVQGRQVSETAFEQKELIFYNFRVDNFDDIEIALAQLKQKFNKEHLTMNVANAWLKDMISNETMHENWWDETNYTKQYFKDFCDEGSGNASYSYGERLVPQIQHLIKRLKGNIYSRGAYLSMTNLEDAKNIGRRIPCSLGYHFMARPTMTGNKLNLVVLMRSCDAINFFPLDFTRAYLFLKYIAKEVGVDVGHVTMSINTLHIYKKDVLGEYKW